MATSSQRTEVKDVSIHPMRQDDLEEARRIFRVAFGTFLGVPEPHTFWADREYVFTRWRTDPGAALIAAMDLFTKWGVRECELLRSRIVQNTWGYTKNSDSGRDTLPRSCRKV